MITGQDKVNISYVQEWLVDKIEKAKAKGGKKKWGKIEPGIIPWVGKVGFNRCVSSLSGKAGITNAKALCGALKREARKRGVLAKEHMGRLEKKRAAKARKFTKSELVEFLKSNLNYGQKTAEEFAELIFKARIPGAKDLRPRKKRLRAGVGGASLDERIKVFKEKHPYMTEGQVLSMVRDKLV